MLWFAWLHLIVWTYYTARAAVRIDPDGGFKNVVVALDPKIPEAKIKSHLLELEFLFQNASKVLNTATRGQTFFKEIVFAVPKKYRPSLSKVAWSSEGTPFADPDLVVTSEDPFSAPYALQNNGCGKQGLRIHIPEEFLSSKDTEKAKTLVKEWAKYRYGVFDESGFVGDELYPACYFIPGSNITKVTDCANKEVVYNLRQKSKESCDPIPVYGRNNHVISSLMSKTELPQVTQFCDDDSHPHNRHVPSKQNVLCREQSTWKVISQHSDFKFTPTKKMKGSLTFKYVIEPEMRIIVAVDTSNNMIQNDRLDMAHNAFSYFVLYNLPENSMVGLKNLKSKEQNPLLVTVKNPSDAERLIDAFPEAYGEEEICIHCGIQQALLTLKTSSGISEGQIVVISATDVEEAQMKSLEAALLKNKVNLYVLYFKKRLKEAPLLQKLATVSGGSFFYILEDLDSANGMSSLTLIYEAFRSIYESFSWLNKNHVLVDQATFVKGSCTTCSMSFQSDSSMGSFQVLLTGPQFLMGPPVIRDKTILSNGNQNFSAGHSSFSYKIKIPAYVFTIRNPKSSEWSLTFERKPGHDRPIVVIIRSTSAKDNAIISMKTWIDVDENSKGTLPKRPPIALYSEVKMGYFPLLNASVSATLFHPESGDLVTMDLTDNGDGDPDITGKDGLFSRYFARVPRGGYYILTTTATKNPASSQFAEYALVPKSSRCCGSSYPVGLARDVGPFKRIVTHRSFYVEANNVGLQFPPRRINDLRVDGLMQLNQRETYVLKWTAPGSNYDYGIAIYYQLRIFNDRDDALANFDSYILNIDPFNVHGQILEPLTAGILQSVIIEPKNISSGRYYLAMRSVNAAGDLSEVSNILEIEYKAPSVPLIDPTGTDITEITSPTSEVARDKSGMNDDFKLAIGLTTGFLFLFIVIGIFLCVFFARRRKDKKVDEAVRQKVISRYGGGPSPDDVQKTESRDALCQSTNSLNVSVISPIHSWPAGSLLSHYETSKWNKQSDTSKSSTIQVKDNSDTISTASSKYSYIPQTDQHLYDSVYFIPEHMHDDANYPYNPSYAPFNPPYTSSLRRDFSPSPMGLDRSSNSINCYTNRSGRSRTYRLGTDL